MPKKPAIQQTENTISRNKENAMVKNTQKRKMWKLFLQISRGDLNTISLSSYN